MPLTFFYGAFMERLRSVDLLINRGLQDTNVGQVAVALGIIQAITHYEAIRNVKPDIIQVDGFDARSSFGQERTDAQAEGFALPEHISEIVEREPAINDIFHDQYMLLVDRTFQIFEDTYHSA